MSLMAIFIAHPYLAALVGILLLAVGRLTRHRAPAMIVLPRFARVDRGREPFHWVTG